ncbi:bifunctional cytidylyltransferase/SDR family oxidoreductase [Brevibacterium aurantiacum]|uniref:bifunctional cytidylyltransferase/SDR family oxidoreductase n=1 Tax=Brevibacterium aurantiacum TaxID=273384 RepID=UPI00196B508F|nr:bifunctional cytidylyltransferase/SDR family oxidoreductase [Brevibacterium aurantiacum]
MKNVGIILAGGVGERVGLSTPKQLIKIAGRPIIEHTLDVFENSSVIDEIIVMMKPGYLDDINAIVKKNNFTKVSRILEGGGSRNDTTQAALAAINEECNVILHDAVRPLISPRILDSVVDALAEHDAVDVAIPSADTIIEVKEGPTSFNTIANIPKRSLLRRGQTPQAFKHSTLVSAYEVASQDQNFAATDDCAVVLKYLPEVEIAVVPGEERNMKVTEPIDIYLADKLFSLYSSQLEGDTDESALSQALNGKVMVIFGGSYGIGKDIGDLAETYGAVVERFSRSGTNTDVQNRRDIQRAHDLVLEKHRTIDFVVNTAGILQIGELKESSEETIFAATEINYLAPIYIAQTFYNELAESQGSLLFFTSSSYTRGRAGYALYSSAKAATVNLTQALSDEWASERVRVNCINPERTGTPMRTKAFGDEDPATLLTSQSVAAASLETLISRRTGHVIDVRRDDPLSASALNDTTI